MTRSSSHIHSRRGKWMLMIMVLLLFRIIASESYIPIIIQRPVILHPHSSKINQVIHSNIFNKTFEKIKAMNPLKSFQLNMRRGRSPSNGMMRRNFRLPDLTRVTVTNTLLLINVAVFILLQVNPRLVKSLLKNNALIGRGEVYRLFSSLFTHTAFHHILMNSYSLNSIGPLIDRTFGSEKYVVFYLFAGVFANLVTYVADASPYSLGASGSIFGLLGALGMFYWRNQAVIGPSAKAGLQGIKQTIMYNLIFSFTANNIDNNAHLAGFVGGALICYLIGPRLYRDRSQGYLRLIDKPILDSRYVTRLFANPSQRRKQSASPKYGTVLSRWFQLRGANIDNAASYDGSTAYSIEDDDIPGI